MAGQQYDAAIALQTASETAFHSASDAYAQGVGYIDRGDLRANWVRIAARFPIRVLLDTPPGDLMRYGATAVIVIEK